MGDPHYKIAALLRATALFVDRKVTALLNLLDSLRHHPTGGDMGCSCVV